MLAEDNSRLVKIDELYALRLDRYVSLPQLVVVGDQSSGKSSVLEGLTGIPFPRDSGLCTRFPTQIVFKRSPERSVDVTIIRSSVGGEIRKPLSLFATETLDDFDQKQFLNVIDMAGASMGLEGAETTFSNDVLKIELCGPSYEHFSVVDLPGIFRKPNPGQTTKDDIVLVRRMINTYIRNPRSIILAVIPANVDIATQEIIQMAEDVDPGRQRTLGVLTKPDLVDKGTETKILDLVNKHQDQSSLGYTVVCNRSQKNMDVSIDDRNANEVTFFDSEPWCAISEERAGITALKTRLNKLLVDVTRQNFQAVAVDVRKGIREGKEKLDMLGSARQTAEEQRTYLVQIASAFQTIATKAVDGYYLRDSCFKKREYRLATTIAELNSEFSKQMFLRGSQRGVNTTDTHDEESSPVGAQDLPSLQKTTPSSSCEETSLFPELGEIFSSGIPEVKESDDSDDEPDNSTSSTISWITRQYQRYKGFEVGSINPSLLPNLFSELSLPWKRLARAHVEAAIQHLHSFIHGLLRHICPDTVVVDTLWERIVPKLLQSYQLSLEHASFLVNVERNGKLITVNHYFADNLQKRRRNNAEQKLKSLRSWVTPDDNKDPVLRVRDTLDAFVSNEEQTINDMHDVLLAYYKVARKRFTDAVCVQAIDHFLISAPTSPLWVLSPEYVSRMSENELEEVAGERPETREKRRSLNDELSILRAGRKILSS